MPVYELIEDIVFPPVHLAHPSGLLAVGGDLSPARLLAAYRSGIFPWYADGEPILWWSPDPRFVLFPGELHVSGTLKALLRKKTFTITFDRASPSSSRPAAGPVPAGKTPGSRRPCGRLT